MDNLSKVKFKIHNLLPTLKSRFKVKSLSIFGSYVRGEEQKNSDLDILVDFYSPPTLIEFIQLKEFLSSHLDVNVDLVMREAVKPHIGKQILKEAISIS